jgi:proline racemase
MRFKYIISVIDSHTAGEPTRIIVDGFPQVKGSTMAERMEYLNEQMDWLRKSLMREPRGHRDMFGAILLPMGRLRRLASLACPLSRGS